MPRRSHKKSRAGCFGCKKRHIKCDETHPKCVNCTTAGSVCSFETETDSPAQASLETQEQLPGVSRPSTPISQSTRSNTAAALPRLSLYDSPVSSSRLNLEHLELLHNYLTNTFKTITDVPEQQNIWCNVAVRHALHYPFLMHEILAVSALHLAYLHPGESDRYYSAATQLQNDAMSEFNSIQKAVDQSSCVAVLIFSSLLALHVLADPTRTYGLDFGRYVDHFTSCIGLMKSIRRLVITDFWDYLKAQPELEPLLKVPDPEEPYNTPQQLTALIELTHNEDLSPKSQVAYESAINRLEWTYARSNVPHFVFSTLRSLFSWPVQLTDDYLDLLNERRPEALVILAYYGVLLIFHRNCWFVGNKGVELIKAIDVHLGSHWDRWMRWPREIASSAENGVIPSLNTEQT